MYCGYCGTSNSNDSRFCCACGKSLQSNMLDLHYSNKKLSWKNAAVFALAILGAIFYLYLVSVVIPNIEGEPGYSRSWYNALPGIFTILSLSGVLSIISICFSISAKRSNERLNQLGIIGLIIAIVVLIVSIITSVIHIVMGF